jgi:endonuclease III
MSRLKSGQIVSIVDALRVEFGRPTLSPLKALSDSEGEEFLVTLPGVSKKVAKCVLMYSLDRMVLPVDVHVHRLAARLGLQTKKRPDTSQELIERAVPPRYRYGFHVNAVAHGRAVCLPRWPKCDRCQILKYCARSGLVERDD